MKRANSKSTERKVQSQRQANSPEKKKKSISLSQGDKIVEDIEDILMEISMKKPRSGYNFYVTEMKAQEKMTSMMEANTIFSKKWAKMSDKDRRKYEVKHEEDKQRYAQHLELVKKNLLQKPLKQGATAYRIYLEENIKKAIDNSEDVSDAKKEAASIWKNMSSEEKQPYEEKRKIHEEFYENLKKAKGTINSYALFVRDQLTKSREKNETMTFAQASEIWKKQKQSVKDKYAEYAVEINEERAKQRNLYELAFGVKPRKPLGAYKFFLMEAANQGKLGKNPIMEGPSAWKKLSDEEKERYQRIAHKEKLCYMVKKMEYDAQTKKNSSYSRPLSALNIFMADMKDKFKQKDGETFFEVCYKKWDKLEDSAKRKYQMRADESKKEADLLKEEMRSRRFSAPKRPGSSYTIYIQDNFEEVKKANPKKDATEIFKLIAEKWNNSTDKIKQKYKAMLDKKKEVFQTQAEEFETQGYFKNGEGGKKRRSVSVSNSASKSTKKAKQSVRGKSKA